MKLIVNEILKFKNKVVILWTTIILAVITNLLLPMYLADVINDIIPREDTKGLIVIGIKMILVAVVGIIASILTGLVSSQMATGISKNIRNKIFEKVQYLQEKDIDEMTASSLITRTNNDVMQVEIFANFLLKMTLIAPVMMIGGVIMTVLKSREMAIILLFSIPIMMIFIIAMGKRMMPLSKIMQDKLDEINLVIRQKLSGIRVARVFLTEGYEEEKFEKVNKDFLDNSISLRNIMAFLFPGLNIVLYGTSVAVMYLGGYEVMNGTDIPVGDIVAVIQYVMQIMMSVVMLSIIFLLYPRASVSSSRIFEVLNKTVDQRENKGYINNDNINKLEFKNVRFKFDGAKKDILENISFELNKGETLAIIGSTGSGKSTLVNLLPRYYEITDGKIELDGIDIRDWNIESLRNNIGVVPQKANLFKGTIKENIEFGMVDKFDETLIENALEIAQAKSFVDEKEDGINFEVAQRGGNLSGGQKQRLTIARTLASKRQIYIFDDSFSALDVKTDRILRRTLFDTIKDAMFIIVAQRISSIIDADKILVLDKGKIVGFGNHHSLLQSCEVYREIVDSQLSEEVDEYEQ